MSEHKTFGWAWDDAENHARRFNSRSGVPCGVKLLGPYPRVGMPHTYQAELWDADGQRHALMGLGESPEEALRQLVADIERRFAEEPA